MKFENGRTVEIIKPSFKSAWWEIGGVGVLRYKSFFCDDVWLVYFPEQDCSWWVSEHGMRVVG